MITGATTLIVKGGMVKVCRLIDTKFYCVEFNQDVKATDIEEYWTISDQVFKQIGRPTKTD